MITTESLLSTESACTFPTAMVGNWTSNNLGTIRIMSTSMHTTALSVLGDGLGTDWDCQENQVGSDKYLIRSVLTTLLIPDYYHIFLCLDMMKVNENSYLYYQRSGEDPSYSNMRLTGKKNTTTSPSDDFAGMCDQSASTVPEYHVMFREGFESGAKTDFPAIFKGKFEYTFDDGSGIQCGNTSALDLCTDTTTWSANYTTCSTKIAYSGGAVVWCVASVQDGDVYYVTVYNADSTVDGSTTFQTSCLVAQLIGDKIFVSQSPTECQVAQSPTVLPTGGALLVLTSTDPCTDAEAIVNTDTDNTAAVVAGVLVSLILVAALIVGAILYKRHLEKKEVERKLIRKQDTQKFHPDHPMAEGAIALDVPPTFLLMKDEKLSEAGEEKPIVAPKHNDTMAAPKPLNPIAEMSLPISVEPDIVTKNRTSKGPPAGKKKTPRFQNSPKKSLEEKFGRKKSTVAEIEKEEKLTVLHDYLSAEGMNVSSRARGVPPVELPGGLMRSKTELPFKLVHEPLRKESLTARVPPVSHPKPASNSTNRKASLTAASATYSSPSKKVPGPAPSRLKTRSKTMFGKSGKKKSAAKSNAKKSTPDKQNEDSILPLPTPREKEKEKEVGAERDSSGYASNPESVVSGLAGGPTENPEPDTDFDTIQSSSKKPWH
ncbi:hypothetical protein ScPMuIL_011196 [Solemya velum]